MWAARQLLAVLTTGLLTPSLADPFTFSAAKHACGVCREVLSGLPCNLFGACHLINTSAVTSAGCGPFCGPARERQPTVDLPDIRVVKGFGTKGYDQVRISVISHSGEAPAQGFFDHSKRFEHKWTDYYVHTAMKKATPGQVTKFPLGPGLSVSLPRRGEGTAGLLIGDPCVDTESVLGWIYCTNGKKLKTYNRTVALLNLFVPDKTIDFWGILGDNFYDRTGQITQDVFSRISWEVKSKMFVTVPGNHDFWVLGSPWVGTTKDQCGNGFIQYYAQDAKSAEMVGVGNASSPFDLSIDPDKGHRVGYGCNLPAISNVFWYNQIGNVGLVGQSGAHKLEDARPFMAEACQWLGAQQGLKVAVLLGHWDTGGDGVMAGMELPQWYHEMADLPGCAEFNKTGLLKYVMGHTHCNEPHPRGDVGTGFRVGAFGMEGCGNYGVPIIDTTSSRVRFWYFDTSNDDLYHNVTNCVSRKGWRQCTDHAALWLDQPIDSADEEIVV